jgi:hypothetical protein
VWLPRLYPSILPVYAAKCRRPKPPKGVGFTDPLSGTLKPTTAEWEQEAWLKLHIL